VTGLRGSTFGGPLDWALPMLPQFAANNRSIIHNRGRVLGSTSALSLLVWNRATVNEYYAWEELGNPGWNSENVNSAMLKVHIQIAVYGIAERAADIIAGEYR
jgi:hypothetical protein